MKRGVILFSIIALIVIDVLISLAINADLLAKERRLTQLREEVENLRREYQVLSREVARLGSLHRIAQLAQSQGFEPSQERIIIVRPSQLVKR